MKYRRYATGGTFMTSCWKHVFAVRYWKHKFAVTANLCFQFQEPTTL